MLVFSLCGCYSRVVVAGIVCVVAVGVLGGVRIASWSGCNYNYYQDALLSQCGSEVMWNYVLLSHFVIVTHVEIQLLSRCPGITI